MEISIRPEGLFSVGGIEVTNSMFTAVVIILILGIFSILISSKISKQNLSSTQLALEIIYEGIIGLIPNSIKKQSTLIVSYLVTLFICIVFSNWFGLLPITGPIGIIHNHHENHSEVHASDLEHDSEEVIVEDKHENDINLGKCLTQRNCILTTNLNIKKAEAFIPLFRAPTADLSFTIALSIMSVVVINLFGIKLHGLAHLKEFLNPLEIVDLLSKTLSFSFRLFGNVFAGEVLLIVINNISYGLGSLPFLGLELFVGFIQAFVFFTLTVSFLQIVQSH